MRKALRRVAAAALVACFAGSGTAQAACPTATTVKAFAAFGDSADYFLAPNGGLESGTTGWTLSKASVVSANESLYLGAGTDTRSLQVSPGGKAVTPAFCVGAEHPTFRFVARQPQGKGSPDVKVSVRYVTQDGHLKDQQVDTYAGEGYSQWKPSRVIDLYSKLGFSDPTATTTAQLVFEVEDEAGGAWGVDDVYVDPWRAG